MMGSILNLIAAAAREGHDRERIHAEMVERMTALRDRLPQPAVLSPYLQRRLAHPEHMDGNDAGRVIVAFSAMPRTEKEQAELLRLGLLTARLGGVEAMLALGPQVVEALQAIPARRSS